ncbi:DUF4160 domain-containing protein [Azospirillum agricola]|uniref:DUF4160 domain-containing protein n=1 Tax=Azospirillum agricola TaxID=1720247 RepID=UPI000A0F228F|nr:DUF4160 domain-containing protein [Azospirillum agricola]SMH54894.1 protein of unknown function [Azospirillum lipoferum]
MPTVAWIVGFAVLIFFEDHDPPHFHIRGKGVVAKILLEDLSIVEVKGTLKPAEIRAIRAWARNHLPDLYHCWRAVQSGETPQKIDG